MQAQTGSGKSGWLLNDPIIINIVKPEIIFTISFFVFGR